MKTVSNALGDMATINTVTTRGGTFFSVKIYTEEVFTNLVKGTTGGEPYRLQIAHADADKRTKANLTEEQILQELLESSLARYGFTSKDLR